jgi:capsular polysaccharide transport system permease protein
LLFYPSVTWIDAILARFLLNTLTVVTVMCILLTGILAVTQTRTVIDLRPVLDAVGMTALLGLGIGALNCFLFGKFPAWELAWSIATRPLFLASGVIFLYDDLPRTAQAILWWNPLMHVTGLMRTGFYPMYSADYVLPIYVLSVGFVTLALGLILLRRHHKAILNN